MAVTLEQSYAACRAIVTAAQSSFQFGMRLFPADRRDDVVALYAFFRITDDIVDGCCMGPIAKRLRLQAWHEALDLALDGGRCHHECLPAIVATAHRYDLPRRIFEDCIDACARDVGLVQMRSWTDLLRYCDGVAGTVGEACLRLLGYTEPTVMDLSRSNARAIQLTNILRDFDEDLARGRLYLPPELLDQQTLTPEEVRADRHGPLVRQALHLLAAQADIQYHTAEPLFDLLTPRDRRPILALTLRYRLLLERLCRDDLERRPLAAGQRAMETAELLRAVYLAPWVSTWHRA